VYALATCTASIFRATTSDPVYGNPIPDNTVPLYTGVIASIVEKDSRTWDRATQTPRVVRVVRGTVGSTTDILTGDRIRDDTHGELYTVHNVTRPRAPGRTPDVELELKRVGGDDG